MRKEPLPQTPLAASHWFSLFISYEQRAGILLILATFLSLVISQTAFAGRYMACWAYSPGIYSLATWIQEVGMSFFFLLVGLELRREFGQGEWQDKRMALFPLSAALGGMLLPAVLYLGCCRHTSLQLGFGIPMATDIAFSITLLSLLGKRVPHSLKIFLTTLAIADDLGAMLVIALFYTGNLHVLWIGLALLCIAGLYMFKRIKVPYLALYLLAGALLWYCLNAGGLQPTLAGFITAWMIPARSGKQQPASRLEQYLHKPVTYCILPLFALSHTALPLHGASFKGLVQAHTLGIFLGLCAGKPLGILLFTRIGTLLGLCQKPTGIRYIHLLWTGSLAGIGFTMSIFISLLAFPSVTMQQESLAAILLASLCSGLVGLTGLRFSLPSPETISGK